MTSTDLKSLVLRLAEVGASVTAKGNLRYRKSLLTPAERALVASNTATVARALKAALAFAKVITDERAAQDEALRRQVAEEQRWHDEQQRKFRRAVIASYDEQKVSALVLAGKWSEADVATWRDARGELLDRMREANEVASAFRVLGFAARIVRTADGEVTVQVPRYRG